MKTEYNDDMFPLDNCTLLQEGLAEAMDKAYPGEGIREAVESYIDPVTMREELLDLFTPKALSTLFTTDFGRGVIIGALIQSQKENYGATEEG